MVTNGTRLIPLVALVGLSLMACAPASQRGTPSAAGPRAAAAVGTAGDFAILASTAVTCTDATILGNVGVAPGTSITQTSCPVTGTINPGDAVATQAQADFLVGYDELAALPCDQTLVILDGQTLQPGVYCFDAAVTSTGGVLTLDGPASGPWVFKVGTLGTGALTATNFSITTPAGTPPDCGSVTWWTAEAATVTDSPFVGTILAGAAVTVTRGTLDGNAYSKAAVTVTGTAVTGCGSGTTTPPTCTGSSSDPEDCLCPAGSDDEDGEDDDGEDDDGEDDDGDRHDRLASRDGDSDRDGSNGGKCGVRHDDDDDRDHDDDHDGDHGGSGRRGK